MYCVYLFTCSKKIKNITKYQVSTVRRAYLTQHEYVLSIGRTVCEEDFSTFKNTHRSHRDEKTVPITFYCDARVLRILYFSVLRFRTHDELLLLIAINFN